MPQRMDWLHYLRKWSKIAIIKPGEDTHGIYLGSGTIKRRITYIKTRVVRRSIVNSQKAYERSRKRKIKQRIEKAQRTKKDHGGIIKWPSEEHRKIYIHWNRKGKCFTRHNLKRNSKTITRGIKLLSKALEKYDTETILYAIDRCHQLFEDKWFKLYRFYHGKSYAGNKLTLSNFLMYPPDKIDWHSTRQARFKIPHSWFEHVLENNDSLFEDWSVMPKDLYPNSTKELMQTMRKYKGSMFDLNNVRNKSIAIKWSRYIHNFAQANRMDGQTLVMIVCEEILWSKRIELKQIGYALADNFYLEKIPNALTLRDPNRYRDYPWNFNIEEIKR